MREIKFKAHIKQTTKVLEVADISWTKRGNIDLVRLAGESIYRDISEVDLIQYADFKDKNGKEIYEGNIIKGVYVGLSKAYEPTEHIYQVIFLSGSFDINDPHCCACCKEECACHGSLSEFLACCESVEVIGNKWENPELLEDKKI